MGDSSNELIIYHTVPESTRMTTRGSSTPLVQNIMISVSVNDNVGSDLSLTVVSHVIPKSIEEDRVDDIGDSGDIDTEGD